VKISLITDEISADPETAIELGTAWGVSDFELRGYYAERVPRLTSYQKDRLGETLERYGARVIALSPGLFKFPAPGSRWPTFPVAAIEADLHHAWTAAVDRAQRHLHELLPASIEYARQLGAQIIVAFSFDRGSAPAGPAPDAILDRLRQAAELTGAAGLTLALEVEAGFWGDTGQRTAQLIQAVGHPALRINWDPGNAIEAGDVPYPDGYTHVRGQVAHVHFKDARRLSDGTTAYSLDGDVDWAGQIQALARDGYAGFISVETHLQPKVASAQHALARLRRLIDLALR
jgi:sugar phosphate isomerase/epimerase